MAVMAVMAPEVSDFQKGTFVHYTSANSDLIGEIKELDNGKLQVEMEGKQKTLGIDMWRLFVWMLQDGLFKSFGTTPIWSPKDRDGYDYNMLSQCCHNVVTAQSLSEPGYLGGRVKRGAG